MGITLPNSGDKFWGSNLNNYLLSLNDNIESLRAEMQSRSYDLVTTVGTGFTLRTYKIEKDGTSDIEDHVIRLYTGEKPEHTYSIKGDVTFRFLKNNKMVYTTFSIDKKISLNTYYYTEYNPDGTLLVPWNYTLNNVDDRLVSEKGISFYSMYLYYDSQDDSASREADKIKIVFAPTYITRDDFVLAGILKVAGNGESREFYFIPRAYTNSKTSFQSYSDSITARASLFNFININSDDKTSNENGDEAVLNESGDETASNESNSYTTSFSKDCKPFHTNSKKIPSCNFSYASNGVNPFSNISNVTIKDDSGSATPSQEDYFKHSSFDIKYGKIIWIDGTGNNEGAIKENYVDSSGKIVSKAEDFFKENNYYSYYLGIDEQLYVQKTAASGSINFGDYALSITYPLKEYDNFICGGLVLLGTALCYRESADGESTGGEESVIEESASGEGVGEEVTNESTVLKYDWQTARTNGISPILNPSGINWNEVLIENKKFIKTYSTKDEDNRYNEYSFNIKIWKGDTKENKESQDYLDNTIKISIPTHSTDLTNPIDLVVEENREFVIPVFAKEDSSYQLNYNSDLILDFTSLKTNNICSIGNKWDIDNDGNITCNTIGEKNSKWTIDNGGNVSCSAIKENNNKWNIDNDGNITCNSVHYTSDRRYKKDIKPLSNCLDIVKNIDVYTYSYIENDKNTLGIIAQDIEKVSPELASRIVHEDSNGKKIVEEHKLLFILWQAFKEYINK